ncbi:patatin [Aureimonas sp. SA4125]|uniref:patatin-like phospholipase family protein n=1 Tax=Aureimonas sp. SA4125 TaxID=2826993 RepID=UPI001CC34CBA|nr:patatin-like phospholipase family protein [Aureimonas sp. SA4125]BDA82822.1 patatin [Aureimonas sp. SA4125]
MSQPGGIGLALGGGGARGLAHIHVLSAFDDLGIRPVHIAGSSIGAIIGAAYASGMSGAAVHDFALSSFATSRGIAGRIWATRPPSFAEFWADGGVRFGQLNILRILGAFLPPGMHENFEDLAIPLTVMATDFYGRREVAIRTGDLVSALAASAALPAIFRPVLREGVVLIDGGIYNPLPFDQLRGRAGLIVASDVNGGPATAHPERLPSPFEALVGASQLMQQSITETRLRVSPPDVLLRPSVDSYGVLDFLKTKMILDDTAPLREEVKRVLGPILEREPEPEEEATAILHAV